MLKMFPKFITEIVIMQPSLEFDIGIRDQMRSLCNNNFCCFSHSNREEHAIILDLITLTANGSMDKARKYFSLTCSFLGFCTRNSQYMAATNVYEIIFSAWKFSYLKALYYLHCNLDVNKIKLHRPIKQIYIDVYNNVNSPDEEMRKLANIHLILENHRLQKDIIRYAKAVKDKRKQSS